MIRNYMHFGYFKEVPRWPGYSLLNEDVYLRCSVGLRCRLSLPAQIPVCGGIPKPGDSPRMA